MNRPGQRRLRVLFVCAMNKQRSVTAELVYQNDARLGERSAGVRTGASRRVSEDDLRWADVVFVMENEQKSWIKSRFQGLDLPRIEVLGVPDEFEVMDAELVEILRLTLDPEIEHLTSESS